MLRISLGLGCFCIGLAACGDNQDPQGASRLWRQIHTAEYRSWAHAPGYETPRPSNAAHGNSVVIYVNATVTNVLVDQPRADAWPIGSLIVKDGFDDGDLALVAVMEKRESGWYWASPCARRLAIDSDACQLDAFLPDDSDHFEFPPERFDVAAQGRQRGVIATLQFGQRRLRQVGKLRDLGLCLARHLAQFTQVHAQDIPAHSTLDLSDLLG